MSMKIDSSAIAAAFANLSTIGDNISHANTVGYKSSAFKDVLGQSIGSATTQTFSQGAINAEINKPLDVAIQGNGFFKIIPMNDPTTPGAPPIPSGPAMYTRDGQFTVNASGFLTDNAGNYVMGMQGNNEGPIKIPDSTPAEASKTGSMTLNLDSGATVLPQTTTDTTTNPPTITATNQFSPTNPSTYNYSSRTTVYDNSGMATTVTNYFQRTSATTWNVYSASNGHTPTASNPDTVLTFNSNGQLQTSSQGTQTIDSQGNPTFSLNLSAAPNVTFTFDNPTHYSNSFSAISKADGNPPGQMVSVSIGADGSIIPVNDAGGLSIPKPLGRKLDLYMFPNENGLRQVSPTQWAQSNESGSPQATAVGTKGAGTLIGNATEGSNVNITTAMIDLLSAQRSFQAISEVVKNESDAMQQISQMGR